jgi:hypothetical protein
MGRSKIAAGGAPNMVEVTAADLMRLLGVNKVSLADLAKRGIAVRGEKRGCERAPLTFRSLLFSRRQS